MKDEQDDYGSRVREHLASRTAWIDEVVRCAVKAHDGAGMAMVSDDESIGDRDSLGRLVAIVEIGVLHEWVTTEGNIVPPPAPPPLDRTPPEDVTAMLEEVARLDAAATPEPWSDQDTPGQVWTAPDEDGESDALIAEGLEDGDQRFIARARTLLPALAKALEASEQGARMLREDHDNGVALLRKAEAEIARLREQRDVLLSEAATIAKDRDEKRDKLEALREKARAACNARTADVLAEHERIRAAPMAALRAEVERP